MAKGQVDGGGVSALQRVTIVGPPVPRTNNPKDRRIKIDN